MPLLGLIVGAIICSLPYLIYSAQFPPPAVTAAALALASAGLAIVRPPDRWTSGLAVGAGIIVPLATLIAIDLIRDPTSHNLWPISLVMALAVSMPGALLGAWLGGQLGRILPPPAGAALTAAGLLLAAAHVPFVLSDRKAGELAAREKFGALVARQDRFREASGGVATCSLRKLGPTFDTPVRRHRPVEPIDGVYHRGTWAVAGDHQFMLLCGQPNHAGRFQLTAAPLPGTLGRWAYCAETDDPVRRIHRDQYEKTGCRAAP